MMGQRWLILGVAVVLLGASGCASCGHHGYRIARHSGPESDVPTCQRSEVYVFAVSSLNPVSIVALDGLREQLNRQGYSKVATGQTIHAGWMAREMRRIRDEEPEAVFVIVGFETGVPAASRLAEKAIAAGLPVAGFVAIETAANSTAQVPGLRTIAVRGGAEVAAPDGGETVVVPNVASYGLATDSRTVEAIGRLLTDAATSIPMPAIEEAPAWSYPHAPPRRPEGNPARDPNWVFMFDQGARRTIESARSTPAVPAPRPSPIQPAAASTNSAIR